MSNTFPTEDERENCPFYFKIGACRNGDRCNRIHIKPTKSQSIVIPHMYTNTAESMAIANDEDWDTEMYQRAQEHVELFYEEVFLELARVGGEIEELVVVDNVSDHMVGNVYCKFYNEEDAEKAINNMSDRFYGAKLLQPELTPVVNFREARCRAFHETRCARGGLCNFMHVKHIPKAVKKTVVKEMYKAHPEFRGKDKARDQEVKDEEKEVDSKKRKRAPTPERKGLIAQWNKERAAELQGQVVPALTA
mmetsp:Transcript_65508/g.192111  ORF Transcript_65508/g.192111 Transcript_65508/m.192111 type:complete len:250 (+) Transcript_65508:89-838(+)